MKLPKALSGIHAPVLIFIILILAFTVYAYTTYQSGKNFREAKGLEFKAQREYIIDSLTTSIRKKVIDSLRLEINADKQKIANLSEVINLLSKQNEELNNSYNDSRNNTGSRPKY